MGSFPLPLQDIFSIDRCLDQLIVGAEYVLANTVLKINQEVPGYIFKFKGAN